LSKNAKFSPYTICPKLSGRIKIPSLPKKNKFDHTEKHFSGILESAQMFGAEWKNNS
jgi:hypothetical protein